MLLGIIYAIISIGTMVATTKAYSKHHKTERDDEDTLIQASVIFLSSLIWPIFWIIILIMRGLKPKDKGEPNEKSNNP